MKQSPQLFTPESLARWDVSAGIGDNLWVKARPLSMNSFKDRIRLAWGVFVGKYDALYWNAQ